ncbi:DciA family protein [Caldimonas brevitalea]|uniref:DciA family protein n=1 Tax=Caldimonas brevitalea TaxID=413882 RepID=UPI0009F8CD43|nr:DciA family protein [Caldimonas brevitalea]
MNRRADRTLPIHEALSRHAGLARIQQLMRESNERFEVVRPLLPPALAAHVKAGPVDEQGWSLLAPNGAAAAKLRQLQPRLEEALRQRGWQVSAIRVKVQSG